MNPQPKDVARVIRPAQPAMHRSGGADDPPHVLSGVKEIPKRAAGMIRGRRKE